MDGSRHALRILARAHLAIASEINPRRLARQLLPQKSPSASINVLAKELEIALEVLVANGEVVCHSRGRAKYYRPHDPSLAPRQVSCDDAKVFTPLRYTIPLMAGAALASCSHMPGKGTGLPSYYGSLKHEVVAAAGKPVYERCAGDACPQAVAKRAATTVLPMPRHLEPNLPPPVVASAAASLPAPNAAVNEPRQPLPSPVQIAPAKVPPVAVAVAQPAPPRVDSPSPSEVGKAETTPQPSSADSTNSELSPENSLFAWADAWSARDEAKLREHYSDSFRPSSKNFFDARSSSIRVARSINVKLKVRKVVMKEDVATVFVWQSYRSDRFKSRVGKVFQLALEDGQWRIKQERVTERGVPVAA